MGNGSADAYAYGAIEISNLSETDIPFANIQLTISFNGDTEKSLIDFGMPAGAVLPAGESHVISSERAIPELQALADTILGESVAKFTGDDTFLLHLNNEVVDSIGHYGGQPDGFFWGVIGNGTQGAAMRRELTATPDVITDDAVDFEGWVGFDYDDFSGLGCAGVDACPVAYEVVTTIFNIAEDAMSTIEVQTLKAVRLTVLLHGVSNLLVMWLMHW